MRLMKNNEGDKQACMSNMLINIDVPNLEQGIRFYTQAFGLSIGRRMGGDFVELLGSSSPIYLLEKNAGSPIGPSQAHTRDYIRHWTPIHFDFVVDDVEGAINRAIAAGASREGPIEEHAYGKLALMSDPFGHGFCLLQFKNRGYDEIVTG